jgi:succinyl-CoA synthetase beta subunit
MRGAQIELLFAAHRDGVVPVLACGLGGIWAEAIDDVALIPLPASPAAVERALRALRGAALFDGSRGREPKGLSAAASFGSRLGQVLLDEGLGLIEVNPAVLTSDACIALDATARLTSPS